MALRYNLPVGRQVFMLKCSKKPARPFRRGFPLLSASPWAEEYLFSFYYVIDKYSPMTRIENKLIYYEAQITLLRTNKCKTIHFYGRIEFIEDDKLFRHFYKFPFYPASSVLFFVVNTFLPGHQNVCFRGGCLIRTY